MDTKGSVLVVVFTYRKEKGKVKITIRLDEDVIDRFGAMADALEGTVGYQTLSNQALREYLEGKAPK